MILVNYTPFQNYLAQKAAKILSDKIKTKVEIAHIRIDFLNHLLIQGVLVEDQAKDTLLYAGELQVRLSDIIFSKDVPTIHYVGLQNTYAHLYRTPVSKEWNYQFIADALGGGAKSTSPKKQTPIELDLKKVLLENVRFHMDDQWVGENMDFDIGNLAINTNALDFTKELLDVSNIEIGNTNISIKEYTGGRPPKIKKTHPWQELPYKTPFNPGNWVVKVKELSLKDSKFQFSNSDGVSDSGVFDPSHIAVSNINLFAGDIAIKGDTVNGNIVKLHAEERSGIAIKTLRAKVSVSPNAVICKELYLETNHSKLQDYYAMHYKHFPAFNYYIDSVTMEAHLKGATVDERDIAFFAPRLKSFPQVILTVSGDGKGTVADLGAKHLVVSDGLTTIKTNVTMTGLPDIYQTLITCTETEIITSGAGILHYAPALRNSPDIALEHISLAYFSGDYKGYIEKFSVNGTIKTNLGTITTHFNMDMPDFASKTAAYSGTVSAGNVMIGDFLRQPILGNISLNEEFSGKSFDPDELQLKIDGTVGELGFKGYNYHNITTHGTLAKKQFKGNLLVDDPNLALEFDGGINYSGKIPEINDKAHLIGSKFKSLNLTTELLTLSADFDLDCKGSNIDNFTGYALLNNIDLKRNTHKLAIDSVLINANGDSLSRSISVKSNDVTASIKGTYQLTKLPSSIQYYLSRYIPNYIKAPANYIPDQNFEFKLTTRNIDSILALTVPLVRGFDSSSFSGSFKSSEKKLTLHATVPHGNIGKFGMHNVVLDGNGDYNILGINSTFGNVVIGDSLLHGTMTLKTTVANDSIAFTIKSNSPDTNSSLTLNGQIIARSDTLTLSILPSQFYLNQAKWDIAGGSKIVYSDKYLVVQGLNISSGLQKITVKTDFIDNDRVIALVTENLDLGQFGTWAGLSAYQPDGRINGTVKVRRLFTNALIEANIKATSVKFSGIKMGTINVVGNYDNKEQLLSLDPQTGIFNDKNSVIASGVISFDSTTNQKIDGSIEFRNTPVSWATPFLTGVLSRLGGNVDGTIDIKGSSTAPDINGTLNLFNGALHLDYMGTNYTIPYANVHVNNKRIDLGKVLIQDSHTKMAFLTGYFSHNLFKDIEAHLTVTSDQFEVMNLSSYENNIFYGNVIASMDSLTLRGPFNNLKLNVYNIAPAAKSRIFIPVSTSSGTGTYSYVTFKNYGKTQDKLVKKHKDKFSISIDANLNTLAEMVIVLDQSNGDEIRAKGEGRIQMEIPPNNDLSINGVYTIDNGTYTFTFNQLFIRRSFSLDPGSTISFNGPFSQTSMNVDATYRAKAKLSDLLAEADKTYNSSDLTDAQTPQWVDVSLHMFGLLNKPTLTFDLDLEDKHSQNTVGYSKLRQLNSDPRQQFTQVGSLLLVGQFVPPDGLGSGVAISGAVNNVSQILSNTASSGLTAIINKLTGDKDLNIAVKYTNYNYTDQSLGGSNRNEIKVGVNKSLFNEKLIVEVGSTSDWGRPTSTSSSSGFNLTGDFRIQYKLNKTGALRVNAFRTSDYDVTLDRDIVRSGVGLNWRKSFDNLGDFFHGQKYLLKEKAEQLRKINEAAKDTLPKKTP